ncbi:MipA/OmpV family protein [Oceaniovalibus guishaninsula]|nr:MipA/OmpV family protein [Oceaniovalibus guishaninsula]
MKIALALAALSALLPGLAAAQDYGTRTGTTPDLIFTLRGGVAVTPDYFGSDDYSPGPDFGFSLGYLRLPGGVSFGSPDPLFEPEGLGLRGSFRYVKDRDEEGGALSGLDDIDATVELGLGLGYNTRNFGAFADLRHGIGGHESFVGELGADLRVQPTDRMEVTLGPRVLIGSDDYADTYFGISDKEAGRSAFSAYDADGGVLSAGLELGMSYALTDDWGVEGAVTWDRLTGDAKDSPIVEAGDRDQYGIRIGITRQITLDF